MAFLVLHAHFSEGRHWLEQLLAEAKIRPSDDSKPEEPQPASGNAVETDESAAARTKVLAGAGILTSQQGEYQVAAMLLQRAIEFARGLENQWLLAATLNDLGVVLYEQGNSARALASYEDGLELYRSRRLVGRSLPTR